MVISNNISVAVLLLVCSSGFCWGLIEGQTVAMIIGGTNDTGPGEPNIADVELFGCPGSGPNQLEPLPRPIMLAGSFYYPPSEGLILCGGDWGEEGSRSVTNECYTYFFPEGQWELGRYSLVQERQSFVYALAKDLDKPESDVETIVVFGSEDPTEILDLDSYTFREYRGLPRASSWTSQGCLVQIGHTMYSIRESVYAIDLTAPTPDNDFIEDVVGEVPAGLVSPGKCVAMDIQGQPGSLFQYSLLMGAQRYKASRQFSFSQYSTMA